MPVDLGKTQRLDERVCVKQKNEKSNKYREKRETETERNRGEREGGTETDLLTERERLRRCKVILF